MKRYDTYKPSGIAWIGEVPEHWDMMPFKFRMDINNGMDYKHVQVEDGFPVMGSGGQFAYASQFMYDGEVVLLGRKGTVDKPLYYNGKFWAVDTMFYAIPLNKTCCKYMYYQATTFPFGYYQTSTALPSMTQTDLGNNKVCVPPLAEQEAIAAYLDARCADIDKVVATQQKRIALLQELKQSEITQAVTRGLNPDAKMKDSGIECIGEVPEHWSIRKIKFTATIVRGGSPRPIDKYLTDDEGYNWIKIGDAVKGCKYITSTQQKIKPEGFSATRMVHENDLILSNSMSFGQPYIMKIDGCIHDGWLAFSNYNGIVMDYLYYTLQSHFCATQFEMSVDGGVVKNLNIEKVGDTFISLPPIEEQVGISEYLDCRCGEIDRQIEAVTRQIELLTEYKQALITEVVTGKRKVS